MKRRVVVTGIGLLTPIGIGKDENWTALLEGKCGVGKITRYDASEDAVQIAAELKNFEATDFVDKKELKRYDLFVIYAMVAAKLAIQDSKLDVTTIDGTRAGVNIGSGIGGFTSILEAHEKFLKSGPGRVTPFFIPSSIINMASGAVSIEYGFKGPNTSVVTACATGTHSIGDAAKLIERGAADIMLSGGSEAAILQLPIAGFANMKALCRRNDEPEKASRPFDKDREGFVMGEGGGVLVLEELEHAKARGAHIYAEVVGYGMSGDAYHQTAPDETGDGAIRCMRSALADAGLEPSAIDYINAHGTSTPFNDMIETKAIKQVFGDHAYKLNVSSTKSMTGHLLGAAGAIEAAYCALALENQIVPPTINCDETTEDMDLNYTAHTPQKRKVEYALSNSFGFGGTNGTLILKKYAE